MKNNIPVKRLLSLAICGVLAGCGGSGSSGQSATNSSSSSSSSSDTGTVSKTLDVKAIDGYLKGALVWLDADGDGQLTSGEPSATTDATGKATLDVTAIATPTDYRVLVQAIANQTEDVGDGTSGAVATKVTKSYVMSAPKGSTIITPLTTLVEQTMSAKGLTQEQAAQEVASQLGLDSSKSAELLTDFMANNSGTYQVYASNLVGALPESGLSSQAAETLLSKGAAIGQAIEAFLAQNPLDASTKPSAIKVVLGSDGAVSKVIKDSDGDGADDLSTPVTSSETLASFMSNAGNWYIASGDEGDADYWIEEWKNLGSGKASWSATYELGGTTAYALVSNDPEIMYHLTANGWEQASTDEDIQYAANSDGSLALTDIAHLGTFTGSCSDLSGKSQASEVAWNAKSAQVVSASATFSSGAYGCRATYSSGSYYSSNEVEKLYGYNRTGQDGATSFGDLFVTTAPVAQDAASFTTWLWWDAPKTYYRLVLIGDPAQSDSGKAQLWSNDGVTLLKEVTSAGWKKVAVHGQSLILLDPAISSYTADLDAGLALLQGKVVRVKSDQAESMLLLNKIAYADLIKGRTKVTLEDDNSSDSGSGTDSDSGSGTGTDSSSATAAAAFVSLLNSDEIFYSLYQEHDALGLTRVDGSSYQGYQLDYAVGSFEPTDTGTFTLSADANNLVTMFDAGSGTTSTIICQQVQALAGVKIQELLAQITSADSLTAMQQTFGDVTFSGDAKAYINQHTDSEGSSTEIVLNEVAYQQLAAALAQ